MCPEFDLNGTATVSEGQLVANVRVIRYSVRASMNDRFTEGLRNDRNDRNVQ